MAQMKLADFRQLGEIFDSTKIYEVGDYCYYAGIMYECIAPHTGVWNESHFEQTDIGNELTNLRGNLLNKANAIETTATGSIASFTDGVEGKAKQAVFAMNPVQDLHGQSSPYPAGGGKQLISLLIDPIKTHHTEGTWVGNNYTIHGLTFAFSTDSMGNVLAINVSGTYQQQVNITLGQANLKANTTYIINGVPTAPSWSTFQVYITAGGNKYASVSGTQFTVSEDGEYTAYLSIYGNIPSTTFYPMVRLASITDGTFAPYINICPISGHTSVNAYRTGVNLLPTFTSGATSNGVTLTVNSDGSVSLNGTATATATFDTPAGIFRWDGITPYWLSGCPAGGNYDNKYSLRIDATEISYSVPDEGSGVLLQPRYTSAIVNTPLHFKIVVRSGTVCSNLIFKPMLNAGTSARPFLPYNGTSVTYSLGSTVYGGTLTINEDGTGTLTKTMAIKTFNGTEDLISSRVSSGSIMLVFILSEYGVSHTDGVAPTLVGNELPTVTSQGLYNGTYLSGVTTSTNGQQIWFGFEGISTVADAKTYLASNPLQVVYELATPIVTTLTAQEVLTLLNGSNNVWHDANGDTTIVYRADTKAYVDGLVTEDNLNIIAPIETGTTASQAYAVGKYFMHNNQFCKAKTSIASGATFTLNTNYEVTTIADELYTALH